MYNCDGSVHVVHLAHFIGFGHAGTEKTDFRREPGNAAARSKSFYKIDMIFQDEHVSPANHVNPVQLR